MLLPIANDGPLGGRSAINEPLDHLLLKGEGVWPGHVALENYLLEAAKLLAMAGGQIE